MKNISNSILHLLAACGLICTLAIPSEANAQLFSEKKPIVYPTENVQVHIQTFPEGARVYLKGQLICASTPQFVTIPCTATIMSDPPKFAITGIKQSTGMNNMHNQYGAGMNNNDSYEISFAQSGNGKTGIQRSIEASSMTLVFKKEGYKPLEFTYEPKITKDKKGKGKQKFKVEWPTSITVELDKDPAFANTESNDRVSREKAGQNDLEKTILRWFIESEPRGARVFWRVISSCPAEVKNTNESYLGSTPYEDTRSFAIPGLTYENSRDVQIEIKVTHKGYIDMVKRFNVRQAIDQMEISTFFEMVESN